MSENIGNRKLVVIGAIIVQLCLGSIYAWSIFQKALYTTIADGGLYGWEIFTSNLPFAIGLLSFAIFMIFAGRWQDRAGPKKVATIGGILLGIGVVLAGLVDILGFGADPITGTLYLSITYGVIGGAGIGFLVTITLLYKRKNLPFYFEIRKNIQVTITNVTHITCFWFVFAFFIGTSFEYTQWKSKGGNHEYGTIIFIIRSYGTCKFNCFTS